MEVFECKLSNFDILLKQYALSPGPTQPHIVPIIYDRDNNIEQLRPILNRSEKKRNRSKRNRYHPHNIFGLFVYFYEQLLCGAGVAHWLCIGLPHNDPGFDPRWGRCKNRATRPSQGTVNGGAVSK